MSSLLVLVDLQPVFLKSIPDADRVLRRCSFAIEAARTLNMPALFTEQCPAKLGATDAALLALADSPVVMGKTEFSVLANAEITAAVQNRQTEHLILAGIETPICVFQTAVDAISMGLQVTLLSDTLGARREADATVALRHLEKIGCHILPSETVFYSMLRDTQNPVFRTFTQIVKKYA